MSPSHDASPSCRHWSTTSRHTILRTASSQLHDNRLDDKHQKSRESSESHTDSNLAQSVAHACREKSLSQSSSSLSMTALSSREASAARCSRGMFSHRTSHRSAMRRSLKTMGTSLGLPLVFLVMMLMSAAATILIKISVKWEAMAASSVSSPDSTGTRQRPVGSLVPIILTFALRNADFQHQRPHIEVLLLHPMSV